MQRRGLVDDVAVGERGGTCKRGRKGRGKRIGRKDGAIHLCVNAPCFPRIRRCTLPTHNSAPSSSPLSPFPYYFSTSLRCAQELLCHSRI